MTGKAGGLVAGLLVCVASFAGPIDFARREYVKYCRLITGGEGPKAAFSVDASLDAAHDEYRISTDGDGVRFVGASERAVLYAVYDFLERRGGCAWFWDGDRVPKRPSIDCAGLNVREKARFEYRGLRYFAHRSLHRFQAEQWDFDDWKRELEWVAKKRLNFMMLRIGMDDLFARAFPETVPYPTDYVVPEAKPRSYDDRTLFWPMKDRSELRKKVLAYARELGLVHPEDCGTMSHWYSRTPLCYLEAVKPKFLPQANKHQYGELTGLVWDIREDKYLDDYFRLTEAHIRDYGGGAPQMFHTIGLGERVCYKDRAKNHALKLYTYDRIISKLRQSYPDTPLLIGSWDFISTWSPEEVAELTRRLDPKNTIILDYTSDIWDNDDNFTNWDIVGKFPWIFGIFNAYEASNEIRGNYGIIRRRFPKAADDPMCKGVCFWPENSHADTLMLDYFSTIAWDASKYRLEDFLPDFCARRYGPDAAKRLKLWKRFQPLAEASRWGTQVGNGYKYSPVREFYPDVYFNLHGWFYGDDAKYAAQHAEYYVFEEKTLGPLVTNAVDTLNALAHEDFTKLDAMTRRDFIDIARTTLARMIELQMARIGRVYGEYVFGGEADAVRRELEKTRALGRALTKVLESSNEFSLNASLAEMRRHPTNPDFEKTLKGNAENDYCRSFIYELSKEIYEPAFDAFAQWVEERLVRGDRLRLNGTADEQEKLFAAVREAFYAKPLAEMAPDSAHALAELPETLGDAAKTIVGAVVGRQEQVLCLLEPLAASAQQGPQGQPVSDARPRSRLLVHGHQPRRPNGHSRLHARRMADNPAS